MSAFKILIDRLKGGQVQKIDLHEAPEFLGPDEPELKFHSEVIAKGETYLTDEFLIVHLTKASTSVLMPCSVCNEMIKVPLKVDNLTHTVPIEEIKGAIFDFSEALREALLIELPRTVECNGGKCAGRDLMAPFLKSKKEKTHFPFKDLD
ncbi:MAG: DUF177 domain-containing protein [Parachlamydiales bacterium]|nr:DUF177 domain-containing protein [Parachlamydiales bacterium]